MKTNWKGKFEGETDANRQERVLQFGKPFHISKIKDQIDATKQIHTQPQKLSNPLIAQSHPSAWEKVTSVNYGHDPKDAAVCNGNTIPNFHPWPSDKSVFISNEIAQLIWTDHWDAAALWNLSCLIIGEKQISNFPHMKLKFSAFTCTDGMFKSKALGLSFESLAFIKQWLIQKNQKEQCKKIKVHLQKQTTFHLAIAVPILIF